MFLRVIDWSSLSCIIYLRVLTGSSAYVSFPAVLDWSSYFLIDLRVLDWSSLLFISCVFLDLVQTYDLIPCVVDFPWELKNTDKAFMREVIHSSMSPNCARLKLIKLGRMPEGKLSLDVGIYSNLNRAVRGVPPVPIHEYPRWRFLLSTDAQAASWHLAKLLAINSVVLKYRSNAIEYYYRSLKESLKENLVLQEIAANGQKFAYKYLSQKSRAAYASIALHRYNALFQDMDSLVAAVEKLERGGKAFSIQSLLTLRQDQEATS
eukprot:gene22312-29385_t